MNTNKIVKLGKNVRINLNIDFNLLNALKNIFFRVHERLM